MCKVIIHSEHGEETIEDLEALIKAQRDAVIVDPVVLDKLKIWLGNEGIGLFLEYMETYGEVCPVFMGSGGIPHPVHFREGMQIRNFLRELPECSEWTHDQFESDYVRYLEEVIK